MNKRDLKKAINKGMSFTATTIPLPTGERYLVEDLLLMIKRLESDKKKISLPGLGELHQVIELVNNQLILSWVMAPDNQARISDKEKVGFDESIIMEIQEKIQTATDLAISAIDVGNKIAFDSANKKVSAADVLKLIRSASEPRIATNVAARAAGPQTDFFFCTENRQLGGITNAQKEFTGSQTFKVDCCRAIRWINQNTILLETDDPEPPSALIPFITKSKLSVKCSAGAIESKIIRCAAFAECSFGIDVSTGYDLKARKEVLHLARIYGTEEILNNASAQLSELQSEALLDELST